MSTYTRKSSYTRTSILASLSVDPIFNALTTAQKNQLIDEAVQKIASLRNSLGKEDFKFDTTALLDAIGSTFGFEKYMYVVAISAGTTWNGTLYAVDTVLVVSHHGMTTTPATPTISAGVMHVVTSGEFTTAVSCIPNQNNILFTTTDPDDIEFDVGSGWGVYSVIIVEAA